MRQGMPMEFTLGRSTGPARRRPDSPMKLLVLADLRGSASGSRPALAQRRAYRVDVDELPRILKAHAPAVELAEGMLGFASLEDFDADTLYARLPVFADLRATRAQPPAEEQDLLARLIGAPAPSAQPAADTPADSIERFIRSVVAPHIVDRGEERLARHRMTVDLVIAERLRRILHAPAFQALEATWRGIAWLVASLELDTQLQVHLLDVCRADLSADLGSAAEGAERAEGSALHALLADAAAADDESSPWSAVLLLEQFGADATDLDLLTRLGEVGAALGAPLLSGAAPALCAAAVHARPAWQSLRSTAAAPWLGLAAHRILLRQPYGARTLPVEGFAFEELVGTSDAGHFLWGHPALGLGILLGRAFLERGWQMQAGDQRELDDLPAVVLQHGDDRQLLPCAEVALDEAASTALIAAGLMPLLSHRNRAAVTVPRFQSCASPARGLAGFDG